MSKLLNNMFDAIEAQQRVVQWGIYAGAFFIAFFAWSEFISPQHQSLQAEISTMETNIDRVRGSDDMARRTRAAKSVILTLGAVDVPRTQRQARAAINKAVNDILDAHRNSIKDDAFTINKGTRLPQRDLGDLLPANQRAETLLGNLEFTAPPDTVTTIIARLERSPDIESVTSIRLSRLEVKEIKAVIEFEAWVRIEESTSP